MSISSTAFFPCSLAVLTSAYPLAMRNLPVPLTTGSRTKSSRPITATMLPPYGVPAASTTLFMENNSAGASASRVANTYNPWARPLSAGPRP
ncbi:hypothetical protein OsJ_29201 [Oryza sativa Japonica Group]|uniref:Secreted protein n=1 Tax=Oryza sativa subsp. japonica TaxID=39947 RepID=B9G3C4_ORYSJ|nr:hypothetical protein OsJ_29201 [Oryza sativa Japonica Group]